jgi:hypothetical protein
MKKDNIQFIIEIKTNTNESVQYRYNNITELKTAWDFYNKNNSTYYQIIMTDDNSYFTTNGRMKIVSEEQFENMDNLLVVSPLVHYSINGVPSYYMSAYNNDYYSNLYESTYNRTNIHLISEHLNLKTVGFSEQEIQMKYKYIFVNICENETCRNIHKYELFTPVKPSQESTQYTRMYGYQTEYVFTNDINNKSEECHRAIKKGFPIESKYNIIHMVDSDRNKVYYKRISSNDYNNIYDDTNLHYVSEYIDKSSVKMTDSELNMKYKYMFINTQQTYRGIVINETTNRFELFEPAMNHKYNISVQIYKYFKPLSAYQFKSNTTFDMIENNYEVIKFGKNTYYNSSVGFFDYSAHGANTVIRELTENDMRLYHKLVDYYGNLDDVKIITITVNDKTVTWHRYYKPVTNLKDSVCEKYLEKEPVYDIYDELAELFKMYKTTFSEYGTHNLIVEPHIDTPEKLVSINNHYTIINKKFVDCLKWDSRLSGWITNDLNRDILLNYMREVPSIISRL